METVPARVYVDVSVCSEFFGQGSVRQVVSCSGDWGRDRLAGLCCLLGPVASLVSVVVSIPDRGPPGVTFTERVTGTDRSIPYAVSTQRTC